MILLLALLACGDKDLAEVDIVVDTGEHRSFDAPFRVGPAVWVRSHAETLRDAEGRVLCLSQRVANWLEGQGSRP